MRSSLGLPTAIRSQQGHGYSFHMGLTDFTRRHGSEETAMRTEATVAGQMLPPVQNTLLYDPCNQAAGCGSLREKEGSKEKCTKRAFGFPVPH